MVNGLDEVVAAETILSDVDGAAGRLIIAGRSLAELAGRASFEDVVSLLLAPFVPDLPRGDILLARLGDARREVYERVRPLAAPLAVLPLYDGLRAGIALIPDGDGVEDALRLIVAPTVLTAALSRVRANQKPIPPAGGAGHAVDAMAMLGRDDQDGALARALDTYLVTVCEHGLNASTFAARVIASTRAGLCSSVLGGLSALKGPLHGGAPGPVITMLDDIARDGDARRWLEREVASGARLMGFGHRIYRTRDPRADALKAAIRRLKDVPAAADRLRFAEQVEQEALAALRAAKPDRVLQTNVEFYTALLLETVGFDPDTFTCVFAMGRVAGWVAHAKEQQATGRLIRPRSRYTGAYPIAA